MDSEREAAFARMPVGTGRLLFRDLERILMPSPFARLAGVDALDFGCGFGRSSFALAQLGMNVLGADIEEPRLQHAIRHDLIDYRAITKENWSVLDGRCFNLIFVCMVTPEIDSETEIVQTLERLRKYLRPGGYMLVVAASDHLYTGTWYNMETFRENHSQPSGSRVKICVTSPERALFDDILWSEMDLRRFLLKAGYKVSSIFRPHGRRSDGIAWKDEFHLAPFVHMLSYDSEPMAAQSPPIGGPVR